MYYPFLHFIQLFRLLIVDTTATILVIIIKLIVVGLGLIIGFFYIDKSKFEDVLTTVTPFVVNIIYYYTYICNG